MKRWARALALILWVVVVSSLLTRFWILHPDLFPDFPKSVAEYLVELYGARNAEQIADLEILLGLLISIPIVCLASFLAWRTLFRRH